MANVTNTITLQDKMTPVLRQIIRSMDSTIKASGTSIGDLAWVIRDEYWIMVRCEGCL